MSQTIGFFPLLNKVQKHISEKYSASLSEKDKYGQLKSYIDQYLHEKEYEVEGLNFKELSDKLYSEMAEYSILTKYLNRKDIEEININGWDDIAITYTDGHIEKTKEHFYSPQHSVDIVKRLLHHSGMLIDNMIPIAQGHLPNNTRIAALKTPIVDDDRGISVSIRLLHPARVTKEEIVKENGATQKMIDFLCMCLRYGVSFVIAGATSSGKTTTLNSLLSTIPDNKRIFTIESGSRELSLIRKKDDVITNNVVHTLSKPSENESADISQEDLVVASLRFNPDIIVVGEMRDTEAYAAVEASLTGHTVVSTIHASAGESSHTRLALLCQKRFPIDFETSIRQVAQAFPLVIYAHKLEDNSRKIMDISECVISSSGEREYHSLFRYNIKSNRLNGNEYIIDGYYEQPEIMSEQLKSRLMQYGVPQTELNKFLQKGADYV